MLLEYDWSFVLVRAFIEVMLRHDFHQSSLSDNRLASKENIKEKKEESDLRRFPLLLPPLDLGVCVETIWQ